jgi:phospholipid transport system transporter-binding protein
VSEAQLNALGEGRMQLSGVLDLDSVPDLLDKIEALSYEDSNAVAVDLRGVERADSAGVAVLIAWMRQARAAQRDIRFLNMPSQMLNIARVSGLDAILPLARD